MYNNIILEMAGVEESEEDSLYILYELFLNIRNNKLLSYLNNIIDYNLDNNLITYDNVLNFEINFDSSFYKLVKLYNRNQDDNILKKVIINNLRIEEFDDSDLNNIHYQIVEDICNLYDIELNNYMVLPLLFENNNNKILIYIIKTVKMETFLIKSFSIKEDSKLILNIKKNFNSFNVKKYLEFYGYNSVEQKKELHLLSKQVINNDIFSDFLNYSIKPLKNSLEREIKDILKFLK